jgi:hypothetical protein
MTPTIQERMRDAAAQNYNDQLTANRRITDALPTMPGDRTGDVIRLTEATAVVQVITNKTDATAYTVVHDGRAARVHVESLELALLLAVQVMAGGRAQDDDYVYAARVLQVAGS